MVKALSDKINVPMVVVLAVKVFNYQQHSAIQNLNGSNGGGLGAPGPKLISGLLLEAAAVLDQALSVKVVLMMDHL